KSESVEFEANVLRDFSACEPALELHRLGYRDDIPDLMQAADLLIHGARQEPLGRVLLEAAASGLATVATEVGGTSEIIVDGESGVLVPPDSVAAMTDAISGLIANAGRRMELASAAQLRISTDFGIANSAESLASLWRSAISNAEADRNVDA
ncbi:MAG: glycosyltransferase family 4 protein, partial [Planctomycetales bacterium]